MAILWFDSLGTGVKNTFNENLTASEKGSPFHIFYQQHVHAIPLFIDANILPISFLYFKSVSCLMHDIHTNTAPSKIVNLFSQTSSIHAYNSPLNFQSLLLVKNGHVVQFRTHPISGSALVAKRTE